MFLIRVGLVILTKLINWTKNNIEATKSTNDCFIHCKVVPI